MDNTLPNGVRERTHFEEPNSLMTLHMFSSQLNSVIIRKEYRLEPVNRALQKFSLQEPVNFCYKNHFDTSY